MGTPTPSQKNLSAVLYESQDPGGKWGSNPKPPVASPLAAVAPDDAVEGLKMLQLTAFPDATFCAAVGGCMVIVNFSASTATNET
jgi:hypothetical protein